MELHDRSLTPEEVKADLDLTLNENSAADMVENTTANSTDMPVSKNSVLIKLSALTEKPAEEITNDEVAHIKQLFYQIRNDELAAEREEFIKAGNDIEKFVPAEDDEEIRFKDLLNIIKDKKAAFRAQQEAERENNYSRKKAIVNELIEMASDTDNVNRHYPRAKDLQTEFKEIGEVPAPKSAELWKSYQDAVERFYDQWKVNKELRDYDFKKNLGEKQLLVEEAEHLTSENDVITAFKRLQELHEKWRQIGPVAKDIREDIWTKFKDASAIINKRYQTYFEERKKIERENEEAKTLLCEKIEKIDITGLKTFADWDKATKEIITVQEDWKKLGFASRKANNALFARFRAACDSFFAQKAQFFKEAKDISAENLAKKTLLCERAESLKDSTDWKATTEELTALQKEWRTIGSVPRKYSDSIWKRFTSACDYFFEQKKLTLSSTRKAEQSNFKIKQSIVNRLKELNSESCDIDRDAAIKEVRELRSKWQETGHVPFREKDKLQEQYRVELGNAFDKFDIHENRARMNSFENAINGIENDENKLYRERERLVRAFEQRRNDLNTYENNLGFFNSKSKNGDSLLRDMERRMQRIKDDLAELEKKIKLIDEKL